MKAFNSTSNYATALANCLLLGGDLAQPMNDLESQTLSIILANFTNSTSGSYWIGTNFYTQKNLAFFALFIFQNSRFQNIQKTRSW